MKNKKLKQSFQVDEQGNVIAELSFYMAIKERITHICYSINRHRSYPVIFSAFLILWSYMQVFALLLNPEFIPRTREDWGPFLFIGNVLDLSRMSSLILGNPQQQETWVFIYLTLATLVFYLATIFFMNYSIEIKKLYFILPIEMCSLFSAALLFVLISPICEVYISIYYCSSDGSAMLLPGQVCWGATHSIYISILTICLVIYVILAFMVAVYFNESNPSFLASSEDGLSRLDTNTEFYYCIYRVVSSILFRWQLDRKLEWVFLLQQLIYSLIFAYRYYRSVPYYNPFISQLYGACAFSHLWQSVNVFFYNAFGGDKDKALYKGVAVVNIIGTLVIFIFSKHLRWKLITNKVIELHHAKISSEEELDVYIQTLLQLYETQQTNPENELLLRGVVWRHKAECMDQDCPMQKKGVGKLYYPVIEDDISTEVDNIKEKIVILTLINSIMKERCKRAGDQAGACFHLVYSNFLFRELGNTHMAIVEIMRAQKALPTAQQRMSIYTMLRYIEDYLVMKYRKQNMNKMGDPMGANLQATAESWDVTIVIKFENLLIQFIKYIEQCASDHIEFWSHLESMLPDLNEVNRIGLSILQTSKDIQKIWSKITKINQNHPKALNIYGYYLREISNDPELGQEYIEKAIAINVHKSEADEPVNDFELMFAEDTAIIMINGSPEKLGKIIKTNSGVFKLFGYNSFEIYGNDVSIIMPGIFAQQHAKFMHHYFETGRQYLIQCERVIYALHRNNYLICVSIVVKPVPSLSSAIPQYIGLIRQINNKDYDYIITDKHGKIDSISMGIYHTLNISCVDIKEQQIYIQLLCPELANPMSFVDEKVNLQFDTFSGRHKLLFSIPKEFKTFSHLFTQTAKDPLEPPIISGQQLNLENKLPYNYSEAPPFFNIIYKLYKNKYPTKELDIASKNIVKACFDYSDCQIRVLTVCEMTDNFYGGDRLQTKIFKIYKSKNTNKKKDSLDEYSPNDNLSPQNRIVTVPRKNPAIATNTMKETEQEGSKRSSAEPAEIKRAHTGVNVDAERSPKSSEGGRSEGRLKTPKKLKPIVNPKPTNVVAEPLSFSGSLKQEEEKEAKKKRTLEVSESAGHLTFHNISSTEQNSLSVPTKDIGGMASQTTEKIDSKTGEPARPLIIKTIDIGQTEVAKELLFRQSTMQRQALESFDPKDHEQKEEEKKETDEPNKTKDPDTLNKGATKKEDESVGGVSAEQKQKDLQAKKPKKEMEGDIGSVASNTGNLMRFIRSLRAALHEEYSPPSITQLKRLALLVLITLLILSVLCYFLSQTIFGQLRTYSSFIIKIRERSSSISNIGKSVRFMLLLNNDEISLNEKSMNYNANTSTGIKYKFNDVPMNFSDWVPTTLENYVNILKEAEDFISQTLKDDTSQNAEKIEPSSINVQNTLGSSIITCSEAINGLITHSLRIKSGWITGRSTWRRQLNDSIIYVLMNAYNSISPKLVNSLDAIMSKSSNDVWDNQKQYLIFFLVASGALLLCISIVFPVVVKIRRNKQELLGLFFEIPLRKTSTQLEKCNQFCKMIHGENEVERPEMEDDDKINLNKDGKMEDETDILIENNNDQLQQEARINTSKKRNAVKGQSANIIPLLIESVIALGILESFFIYECARSAWFTNTVNHLMTELGETARRMYTNELYFSIDLELISTNGSGYVMGNKTEDYVDSYGQSIMKEQESFLQTHSDNSEYSSNAYKSIFDAMIYSDICVIIYDSVNKTEDIANCQKFMSGIMQKGLSSSNVAFWDALRDVAKDFKKTKPRTLKLQNAMINDKRIRDNHWLLFEYFSRAYQRLLSELQSCMEGIFSFEEILMFIMFILYLFLMVGIYIIFTQIFIDSTRNSLWVTKSMLTILPAEIILQVPKIKRFLILTSKSVIYGIKAD